MAFGDNREFRELYNMFDADGSGEIDESEFVSMCFTLGIQVEYPEFARDKGGLEFDECCELLERLSKPLIDDGIHEAFRVFDVRNCGHMA